MPPGHAVAAYRPAFGGALTISPIAVVVHATPSAAIDNLSAFVISGWAWSLPILLPVVLDVAKVVARQGASFSYQVRQNLHVVF